MKRLLLSLTVMLLLSVNCASTFANHIFGGELLYTNISGLKYAVTLTLYGDCSANDTIFSTLYTSKPFIEIYKDTNLYSTIQLSTTGIVGQDVSPVCPSEVDSTACNGGTLPGVRKFVYSDTVTLSGASDKWHFIFAGYMGYNTSPFYAMLTPTSAGRSTQLTNIIQGSVPTIMYIEASLNNIPGPNSSPEYSTIPTPFYCINVQEQYNQGAVDPDNDSLAFSLTPALDSTTGGDPVNYVYPYTATDPLSTNANGFIFNNLSGQMTFTANMAQDALVVSKVSEYRNGVLVGTSVREMTIIILSDCHGGTPTIPPPANITGAVSADTNATVLNVCTGTPQITFNIPVTDSTSDSIQITTNSIPPGAIVNITNNGSSDPQLSFSWNTTTIAPGIYNFFVTYNDYHCPISSHQTIAYTINIVNPNTIASTILYPTQCIHKAYIQYNLTNGALPRMVTISQGGNVIATYTDTSGVIKDSIATGSYTATVGSNNLLCPTTYNFSVIDSGTLPIPKVATTAYCLGEAANAITVLPVNNNATITWYDNLGNVLPGEPALNTNQSGTDTFYFSEQYLSCKSNEDTVPVTVYPLPNLTILNTSQTLCYGDLIELEAIGGATYTWTPQDQLIADPNGSVFARILQPVTFTVHTTNTHGCTDSASISFTNIEQCCQFSYPTAFTPNNDGRNDDFRIITYGNMTTFSLSIYDRWGRRVFWTNDPYNPWHGDYNGKPCEEGTYFYMVQAQCLTGHTEQHKGDLTLLR